MPQKYRTLQQELLKWFDRHRRQMPWRAEKGVRPDPYHVWLSEIMLQQTTVTAVKPYFEKFVRKWPTVQKLARAKPDDVLHAWAGLGYYARARNLHKCAQIVSGETRGIFPDTVDGLLSLPGIGPYTAAAIAAIAFDRPAVAVDGNVERVVSRLFAVEEPLPKSKPRLRSLAQDVGKGAARPGDFVQAFMELGATVCTPRNPACSRCPWRESCRAFSLGIVSELPRKAPKKTKPQKFGTVFWIEDGKGNVLVRRRPETGLLGGMVEFPGTKWLEKKILKPAADGKRTAARVAHSFTHFDLELEVRRSKVVPRNIKDGFWHKISKLDELALPSLMQKVVRLNWPKC